MNKAHRDRIAFMRICSGKFEAGMEVNHVQGGRKIRLSQPQQLMAQDRKIVEEHTPETLSESSIRAFSPLETLSARRETRCSSREFLPSRRSISPECARWTP